MEIGLHYYQFNIGDYRRDTIHLTLIEHGIYRQLLDSYYLNEGPITKSEDELMRSLCVRNADEQEAFRRVVKEFFIEVDGTLIHRGCDKVIDQFHRKSDSARASAMARWDKKDANAMRTQCDGNATHNPIPITHNPIIKTSSGNGLLPCPHEEIIGLFHKVLPELPEVRVWNQTRQGYLKARWRELVTEHKWETKEQGLEWFEKFFTWVRASKFLMGKVPARPGARAFECELEWLLRPNNWAKLIEGKYHAA
jgi:uncharacterized protein YdaU (DUF1376 family)